jgi:hypothetical protein
MCRAMAADTGRPAPEVALRFYRAAGYDDEQLERYKQKFGNFGRAIAPLPDSFRRLVDRDTITIGGRYWQVIVGRGHSPEHASLYCPGLKLLISGDQVLPRISSNVSVFPTEPAANPLLHALDWIEPAFPPRRIDLRSKQVAADIAPFDVEPYRLAVAQAEDLIVERHIAIQGGHVAQTERRLLQGRQHADHAHAHPQLTGSPIADFPAPAELLRHAAEHIAPQGPRQGVEFQIEGSQFRHHQRLFEALHELLVLGRGIAIVEEQTGLQFDAPLMLPFVELPLLKPLREQPCLDLETLCELGKVPISEPA